MTVYVIYQTQDDNYIFGVYSTPAKADVELQKISQEYGSDYAAIWPVELDKAIMI